MAKTRLVAEQAGSRILIIEPCDGVEACTIAALLNTNKAFVRDNSIVQPMPAPYEGSTILAKVILYSDNRGPEAWVVSQPDECCQPTAQEKDRARVTQLNQWIHQLSEAKRFQEAVAAAKLGRALLEKSGGLECEEGVWLVNAQAHVVQAEYDDEAAIPLMEEALVLAKKTFPEDHPGLAVIRCNVGEAYEGADRGAEALPLLESGLAQLRQPTSVRGDFTAAYIAMAIEAFEAVLQRLKQPQSATDTQPAESGDDSETGDAK